MNLYTNILFVAVMMIGKARTTNVFNDDKKVDIAILVDNPYNNTISAEDYKLVINQINSVIQKQKFGSNNTFVGLYFIAARANLHLYLGYDQKFINESIAYFIKHYDYYMNNIKNFRWPYPRKFRDSWEYAINGIFEMKFQAGDFANRMDASNRLIFISFRDHNFTRTRKLEIALQSLDVEVHAIGIGNVTDNALKLLSGSSNRAIKINKVDLLENVLTDLFADIITKAPKITVLPISPVFLNYGVRWDIIIVLNTFSSRANKNSTINATKRLNLFYGKYINAGVVAFCGKNSVYISFQNNYADLHDKVEGSCLNTFNDNAVIDVKEYADQTIIGLQKALDIHTTIVHRPDTSNSIVVVADKVPSNLPKLKEVIDRSIARNITVYLIGIGKDTYDSLVRVNGAQKTFYCENFDIFEYTFRRLAYNRLGDYISDNYLFDEY